jgi:hypothetical protein
MPDTLIDKNGDDFLSQLKKHSQRILYWLWYGRIKRKTWKLALGPIQVSYNKQKVQKHILLAYIYAFTPKIFIFKRIFPIPTRGHTPVYIRTLWDKVTSLSPNGPRQKGSHQQKPPLPYCILRPSRLYIGPVHREDMWHREATRADGATYTVQL